MPSVRASSSSALSSSSAAAAAAAAAAACPEKSAAASSTAKRPKNITSSPFAVIFVKGQPAPLTPLPHPCHTPARRQAQPSCNVDRNGQGRGCRSETGGEDEEVMVIRIIIIVSSSSISSSCHMSVLHLAATPPSVTIRSRDRQRERDRAEDLRH